MDGQDLCTAELELFLKVRAAPHLLACSEFPTNFMPRAAISHVVDRELLVHMCAAVGSLQV